MNNRQLICLITTHNALCPSGLFNVTRVTSIFASYRSPFYHNVSIVLVVICIDRIYAISVEPTSNRDVSDRTVCDVLNVRAILNGASTFRKSFRATAKNNRAIYLNCGIKVTGTEDRGVENGPRRKKERGEQLVSLHLRGKND